MTSNATLANISQVLPQACLEIVPAAVSLTLQLTTHDHRINRILAGIGFTISGVNVLAASGVGAILKSRCWTNPQTSTSKTPFRYGSALAGLASTCFGLYNITMGILEFTASDDTRLYQPFGEESSNFDSNSSPCEKRLTEVKERLLSCPEGKELWESIKEEGPFTVRCGPTGRADAWTEFNSREIMLTDKDPVDLFDGLLFELGNLKGAKTRYSLSGRKCDFGIDYALEMEKYEYETSQNIFKISESCINGKFWPQSARGPHWDSFEDYLRIQEKRGHTELYRKDVFIDCVLNDRPRWLK